MAVAASARETTRVNEVIPCIFQPPRVDGRVPSGYTLEMPIRFAHPEKFPWGFAPTPPSPAKAVGSPAKTREISSLWKPEAGRRRIDLAHEKAGVLPEAREARSAALQAVQP